MTDKHEFESIAMPYMGAMYKFAYALCGNRDSAEDLVQDTFLKAFEKFKSFDKGSNCRAWLAAIMRNKWIDQLRHNQVAGQTLPLEQDIAAKPAQNETEWSDCRDFLEKFSDEQVIKALLTLGEEQRTTLFLIDVEQLSQDDVAQIMDIAVGTVKSRTSRARAALKNELIGYAKEMGYAGGET